MKSPRAPENDEVAGPDFLHGLSSGRSRDIQIEVKDQKSTLEALISEKQKTRDTPVPEAAADMDEGSSISDQMSDELAELLEKKLKEGS